MVLPMTHTPPPSLTARPGDAPLVLHRPLAVTSAYRRMRSNHHNPGAHEDVYTEFGGLPYVCSGAMVGWGATHAGVCISTTATRALVRMCTLNSVGCLMRVRVWWWGGVMAGVLVRMCTLNSVDCLMCVRVWWWGGVMAGVLATEGGKSSA